MKNNVFIKAALAGLLPDKIQTVSSWADDNRVLSSKDSSEPGKFRTDRTPYIREINDCLSNDSPVEEVVFMAGAQIGKALRTDTPILTPTGFKQIGQLVDGDVVYDETGKPCNVVKAHAPLIGRVCYRVHFSDNTHLDCDEEHLWTVEISRKGKPIGERTLTTAQMLPIYKSGVRNNLAIPVVKPVQMPEQVLQIDPYMLGFWLGDGTSTGNSITVFENDLEHLKSKATEAGHEFEYVRQGESRCYRFKIDPIATRPKCSRGHEPLFNEKGRCVYCSREYSRKNRTQEPMTDYVYRSFGQRLSDLNLFGNKHIPAQYLFASEQQRRNLLQGLMDSDGSVSGGRSEIATSEPKLLDSILFLVRSLGFKPSVYYREEVSSWRISFVCYAEDHPFTLPRHIAKLRSQSECRISETYRRRITKIEPIESVAVRCITVDSPNRLYLAGEQLVPTHNTSAMLSWLGYVIDVSPGPMLMVQPTVDLAKRFSRQRVSPMIEETNVLRSKISNLKRDSENTILMKAFQGGTLMLAGANSAAGLRSMPIRYLALDEIDAYPLDVEGEGSPVELAKKRTTTFNRKKIFMTSTPTVKDASMIEAEYKQGDQRKYYVPCPHCDHMQHLEWKNLKWVDGDPTTAAYACASCGVLIEERYKTQMLLAGEWRAHAKSSDKKRSYHLNSLYSPLGWKSWASIVEDFIKAKDDPPALKTWVNTTLGETWEDNYSATLDPQNLMGRCEDYTRLSVPEKVLFCTMGVDVQDDRIEATLYGWAEGEEAWKLEHFVVYGDPSMPDLWNQLTEIRRSEIRREDGHYLTIECCAIDSGGHHTQQVYQYAKENRSEWVIAVKGSSVPGKPTIGKPSKVDFKLNGNTMKNGAELYIVGSNSIKTIIYSRLRKQEFGPGSYHFPKSATHDFFEQLTAEKQQVKYLNGMPSKIWVKKNGARNEALDTAVYAYAALNHVYLRLNKHTLWQQFRDLISNRQIQTTPQPAVPVAMLQQNVIVRKKSEFWG